ncbi:hypothetical protein B566_EDAN016724, partial [Ephemera danica]
MSRLKRKRVAPPLFYDIESNTLYPKEDPKRGRFDDMCRICATPASPSNDLIDIYGQHGKTLKLSSKINKFLPIIIYEADSLPHMICVNCRTILLKIDSLFFVCQKADVYFHSEETNTELLEVFDGEDPNIPTYNNPDVSSPTFEPDNSDSIGFTVTVEEPTVETSSWCLADNDGVDHSELPTFEPDECSIKEECLSEFSDTEYNPTISEVKSIEPTKTKASVKKSMTKSKSILKSNVKEKKGVKVTATKRKSAKVTKKVEPTTTKNVTTKSGRRVKEVKRFENDSDEHSATESEGNEDSDDPDFNPVEDHTHYSGNFIPKEKQSSTYDPITALTPKQLPLKCEYCGTTFKIGPSAECHYEIQHNKHLCAHCFVHYQTRKELIEHYKEEHTYIAEYVIPKKSRKKSIKIKIKPQKSSEGSFMCILCDNGFKSQKKLKAHLKVRHETLMCYQCSTTFVDQSKFEEHLDQENHGKMCRICKIDFWCMKLWRQHSREHYNY